MLAIRECNIKVRIHGHHKGWIVDVIVLAARKFQAERNEGIVSEQLSYILCNHVNMIDSTSASNQSHAWPKCTPKTVLLSVNPRLTG